MKRLVLAFSLFIVTHLACGMTFVLPDQENTVVGEVVYARSQPGETLAEVGRRYDIGYYEMLEANPNLDKKSKLRSWTSVVIPSRFVLPSGPHEGIVINLAELRLYYFVPGKHEVITFPVGIGKEGWETPLGTTKVAQKVKNPYWRPTKRVKEDAARKGYVLPDVWPPGPDNPLGDYMMRLGWYTYLIHGTNRPDGVGKRSSAGCIRMYPEDIEQLYAMAQIGMPVRVINKPIKLGWQDGMLYMEAHQPLQEKGKYVKSDSVNLVSNIYKAAKGHHALIKWREAQQALQHETGIPVLIGSQQPAIATDETDLTTEPATTTEGSNKIEST